METDFSGKDIYVSPDVKSGPLYNVTTGKPKTIEEVISEILYRVSNLEKESDVKKQIEDIKNIIGPDLFVDLEKTLSSKSIDNRISDNLSYIKQIASDVFNKNSKIGNELINTVYSLKSDRQTVQLSVMDIISRILDVHGGTYSPSHTHIYQEEVIDFTTQRIKIGAKEAHFIFPNNNELFSSYEDQTSTWKYRVAAVVTNIMMHVSSNTLNGTTFIRFYINGSEVGKGISIGPNAQGSFDMSEMGISVNFMDRIAIRISTDSATSGEISIDNSAITLIKGPDNTLWFSAFTERERNVYRYSISIFNFSEWWR